MPLTTARQEITNRFLEAQAFLTLIKADEQPFVSQTQDLNTRKGLFLILLYGAIEYSINRAVTEYAEIVNSTEVRYDHIDSKLYAFALDPQLTSCAMVGREHRWQKRFDLFHKQSSTETVKLSESAFLDQLENIWDKTIRKTFHLLGIREVALYDPRVAQYINEVVERRNAVAHGRESAATVGQTYNSGRLQILHDELSMQIQYMVVCLEQHLDDKMFIKPQHKDAY